MVLLLVPLNIDPRRPHECWRIESYHRTNEKSKGPGASLALCFLPDAGSGAQGLRRYSSRTTRNPTRPLRTSPLAPWR